MLLHTKIAFYFAQSAENAPAQSKTAPARSDGDLVIEKGTLKAVGAKHKELILPEGITAIAKNVFADTKVKKLVLPGTLKKISGECFRGANGINEVVISQGTESVGAKAFYTCKNIKSVLIPDSVKTIGDKAFKDCEKLASVTAGSGTTFTSRIKVIRLRAGEKECAADFANIVYVMDFHEQNTGYDEIIMHLSKPTLQKFLEYTLNFLLTGTFDPKYGMIERTSRAAQARTRIRSIIRCSTVSRKS